METKKKREEEKGLVRLGLIYDVEHQRFDIVYKDLATNEIRIGPSYGKKGQKVNTSISAT